MSVPWCLLLLALLSGASCDVTAEESDTCPAPSLWADLLEEWATSAQDSGGRQGRVMALPPTKGYYVTERIDGPLTPPPPPHGSHHTSHGQQPRPYGPASAVHGPYGPNTHGPAMHSHGPQAPKGPNSSPNSPQAHGPHQQSPPGYSQYDEYGPNTHGPSPGMHSHGPQAPKSPNPSPNGPHGAHQQPSPGYSQYDEWKATPPPPPGAGKIVNKPPNPYKDKFKPSYQVPNSQPPQQSIPVSSSQWPPNDRVDSPPPTPPPKQVSETDLYLLTAIEKLVYRADLMEKRLRKLEDSVHYLVAGKEVKPDPCAHNFTRVGDACYQISAEAGDWKAASLRCRKLRAHLVELTDSKQKRALFSTLLANDQYKGKDFWTGGLNPGLLWIWSHSAKPVNGTDTNKPAGDSTDTNTIVGAGRCLALVHDPATATYVYRGQDCALRHRYICELPEDRAKVSNEIERVARELRLVQSTARTAKILWERR